MKTYLVGIALFLLALLSLPSPARAEQPQEKQAASEYCLALNLYYEARNEPEQAMYGVAYVTSNRSIQRRQTICHVVFAYKQFSWVDQYHVLDEHKHIKAQFRPRAKDSRWKLCQVIAHDVLAHPEQDFTGGAQFFVAHYIFPRCQHGSCRWSTKMAFVGRYGSHLFFKEERRKPEPQARPPKEILLASILDEVRHQHFFFPVEFVPALNPHRTIIAVSTWRLT